MASSCACSCDCLIALCLNVDSGSAARLNLLYMFLMKHVPSSKSATEAGAAAFINTNVISSVRGGKKNLISQHEIADNKTTLQEKIFLG